MRLIDEAYLQMYKVHGTIGNIEGDFVSGVTIAHAPTIDAEPVRHGRIIEFWDNTYHPRKKVFLLRHRMHNINNVGMAKILPLLWS